MAFFAIRLSENAKMLALLAAAASVGVCDAHMLMATPVAFSTPQRTNGPILADGSNFPCQSTGSYVGAASQMALGSSQPLSFTGQATHGGGSCQISLTTGAEPNKDSVWRVIHSIEGGCPARNQAGNMGDDAAAADPSEYNFTIPSTIPAGSYSLAWTWFNKVGNREMYMNCAPVKLTGTSTGSSADFDKLPKMFVANIGNGCGTASDTDLLFPDPGESVEQLNGATSAFSTPTGSCQAAAAGGAANSAAGSGATSSAAGSTAASTSASSDVSPAGGVFVTVASGGGVAGEAPAAATSAPAVVPAPAAAESSAAAAPAAASAAASGLGAPSSTSTSGSGSSDTSGTSSGAAGAPSSGACSDEGTYVCLGKSYQVCASGQWSAALSMAVGTQCTGATSSSLNIEFAAAGKERRSAKVFRSWKADAWYGTRQLRGTGSDSRNGKMM